LVFEDLDKTKLALKQNFCVVEFAGTFLVYF